MSREVVFENSFKKSLKRMKKRGKHEEKLYAIMRKLANDEPLPDKCRPHKLVGNWSGNWECHIEPDWLLIYRLEEDTLILEDTGTHSDLF